MTSSRVLRCLAFLLAGGMPCAAQPPAAHPEHDITTYGVVLEVPGMDRVQVKKDVAYKTVDGHTLALDVYTPPGATGAPLPTVVFVNGVGDRPDSRLKDWAAYRSWARLSAASGFAAVTFDARGGREANAADIADVFAFLRAKGRALGVDPERLGVWACSGNVTTGLPYVMSAEAVGVRCAAILYGAARFPDVRSDVPVLLIRAGRDSATLNEGIARMTAQALTANAPWSVVNAPTLPHAFDCLVENDESRGLVRRTLDFFDAHLRPKIDPAPEPSLARLALQRFFARETEETVAAYERIVAKDPGDAVAWGELGNAQIRVGRRADAIASLEKSVAGGSGDPNARYNIACAYALDGKPEQALDALEKAVREGYRDAAHMLVDEDLVSLRERTRFKEIVARAGAPR